MDNSIPMRDEMRGMDDYRNRRSRSTGVGQTFFEITSLEGDGNIGGGGGQMLLFSMFTPGGTWKYRAGNLPEGDELNTKNW